MSDADAPKPTRRRTGRGDASPPERTRRARDQHAEAAHAGWGTTAGATVRYYINRRLIGFCLLPLIAGCAMLWIAHRDERDVPKDLTPKTMTCAELVSDGPGGAAMLTLTDFFPSDAYVFEPFRTSRGRGRRRITKVGAKAVAAKSWVPLYPKDSPAARALPAPGGELPVLAPTSVLLEIVGGPPYWLHGEPDPRLHRVRRPITGRLIRAADADVAKSWHLVAEVARGSEIGRSWVLLQGWKPPVRTGTMRRIGIGLILVWLLIAGAIWWRMRAADAARRRSVARRDGRAERG